jgi:hypothetical protein
MKIQPSPNMLWALSNGHIMLLKHELMKGGGVERIRSYVKLWTLLRRIALDTPSIIQDELDYDLIKWLSPMFVNLGMDHPAKQYLLKRIRASGDCYIKLASKAVEQSDLVSICALIRRDYAYQSNFSLLKLNHTDASFYQSVAIPPILNAALSRPPDFSVMKAIRYHNNLWLFELLTWLSLMDLTYFQWSMSDDAPLSFSRAFKAISDSGGIEKEVNLLQDVLAITHTRLVELDTVQRAKSPFKRPPFDRRNTKVLWRPVIR